MQESVAAMVSILCTQVHWDKWFLLWISLLFLWKQRWLSRWNLSHVCLAQSVLRSNSIWADSMHVINPAKTPWDLCHTTWNPFVGSCDRCIVWRGGGSPSNSLPMSIHPMWACIIPLNITLWWVHSDSFIRLCELHPTLRQQGWLRSHSYMMGVAAVLLRASLHSLPLHFGIFNKGLSPTGNQYAP